MKEYLVAYKDLPQADGAPPGSSWALFNKAKGSIDQLGTLNFLTPEVVAAAAKEIQTGTRFALDLPLDVPDLPFFGRKKYEHTIIDHSPTVCDDHIHINTQSSTQWDGFRHVCHAKLFQFYQGLPRADVLSGAAGLKNGIQNWVEAGSIAGRGVLLDWVGWLEATGQEVPSPFEETRIPLPSLRAVAKHQGTTFKPGDILFIRSGFVKTYAGLTSQEKEKVAQREDPQSAVGVEATMEVVEWIWNNHFAAVAGDAPAFEAIPALKGDPDTQCYLHDHLLTRFGCPIGELFNLEQLAEHCRKLQRWSFFLTSAPLHIPGGVASPPNAIAIF